MIELYIIGYVLAFAMSIYELLIDKEERRRRYFLKGDLVSFSYNPIKSYWVENISVILILSCLSWLLVVIFLTSKLWENDNGKT